MMIVPEMQHYQDSLIKSLYRLRDEVASAQSELVRKVLDDNHFKAVEKEIREWCENNQYRKPIPSYSAVKGSAFLMFSDRLVPGEFQRFDEAVLRIEKITKKKKMLRNKVGRILGKHPQLHATVFEIYCLARFVNPSRNVELIDIDFKHQAGSEQNLDGLIKINGREILFEITYIGRSLLESLAEQREQFYRRTGKDIDLHTEVGTLDIEGMIGQVTNKVNDKLNQIGNVTQPAILSIALPHFGADFVTANWALDDAFQEGQSYNIGCVVISGSYLLREARVYFNDNATYPFSEPERNILNSIFC